MQSTGFGGFFIDLPFVKPPFGAFKADGTPKMFGFGFGFVVPSDWVIPVYGNDSNLSVVV